MPITRAFGPSVVNKTFEIPCSGEGIFVAVNMELYDGSIIYWDGTRYTKIITSGVNIADMTVQDGTATVTVSNDSGYYSSTRVCFIPGDPLASS